MVHGWVPFILYNMILNAMKMVISLIHTW